MKQTTTTFDVHFNNSTDSNSKGFSLSFDECLSWITINNGTDNSYFADYKGGIVSIVDNSNGQTVWETEVL